jgi:hypothetical protein
VEVEEPRLKMFRVKLDDAQEVEYDENGKKQVKLKDLRTYQKYEKFG